MTDPGGLVVCPSCGQLAALDAWHACRSGQYAQLARTRPQAAPTAVQVPRVLGARRTPVAGPPRGRP